jgi:hypothetical protein
MRVSPSSERASGTEKRNAAHNQAARGELCIMPHRAEAHTTVLSKSVGRAFALS